MLIAQNPKFKLIYTAMKPYIAEFGIRKIAVFGSYARGEDKPDSDIDIIVDMTNNFGIYKFIGLKQSLEEKLGKRIDIAEPQCLEPLIKEDILSQAITIYKQR